MESTTRCPKCGFVSSSYFAVCPNCGYSFLQDQPPQQVPYQQPQTQYTYEQFQTPTRKSKTGIIIALVIVFIVFALGIGTYIAIKVVTNISKKTTTEETFTKDSKNISDTTLKARKTTSEKETTRLDNKRKDEEEALKRKELNKNKIRRNK
jgi:uncharacterized protein HemX